MSRLVTGVGVIASLLFVGGVALASFGFIAMPVASTDQNTAAISWENEQPGDGHVWYGTSAANLNLHATDFTENAFTHVVEIVNLAPGTQYFYQVRSTNGNGDVVAESDVENFITLDVPEQIVGTMSHPSAEPRRIGPGGRSQLSVWLHRDDLDIKGALVTFVLESGNASLGPAGGSPAGSSIQVRTDEYGIATVELIAGNQHGLARVQVSSPNAENTLQIPVVIGK